MEKQTPKSKTTIEQSTPPVEAAQPPVSLDEIVLGSKGTPTNHE